MTAKQFPDFKQYDKRIELVREPVSVPTIRKPGRYIEILDKILDMNSTSLETGASPHLEWKFTNRDEAVRVASGLFAAKRRNKNWGKVAVVQRDKTVYLWHEE